MQDMSQPGEVIADLGQLVRVYWSLFVGNIVEWYEFAVYGYLVGAMKDNFFQGGDVEVWLGFAVTFLARPLGGLVFGVICDRCGRSLAVNASLAGMLFGTCGQGALPTFSQGEVAGKIGVTLLIVLRFVQGLCAAGEISTISTYITEVGLPRSLGRGIALISITVNLGFLSAKSVVYALEASLAPEDLQAWGWRIPFFLALLPGLAAIAGRRCLPESEVFVKSEKEGKVSISQVVTLYWRNMLVGMGGMACFAIMQYGGLVWMQSYLKAKGMRPSDSMCIDLVVRFTMMGLALPVGWLTDVKGVGWVTLLSACLVMAAGLPLFSVLSKSPSDALVGLGVIGACFGPLGAFAGTVFFLFVVELFPAAVRGAGVGISYNLGFSLFGGLAPVLMQLSLKASPLGPGILLSAGGAITACAVLAGLALQRAGQMKVAHVRRRPYLDSKLCCVGEAERSISSYENSDSSSSESESS